MKKPGKKEEQQKNVIPLKPKEFDDELLIEWNLLRILGMYFCLDNKKAAKLLEPQEFLDTLKDPDEIARRLVQIAPHPRYGYPSIGALRVFFAILRKFFDSGYPIDHDIEFSQRELNRLIGSSAGGFQNKKIANYLLQLRWTVIESRRYNKATGEWFFRPFSLISDMYLSARKNSLTHCYVELDKGLHQNINAFYGLRMLYHRLEPLSPTGQMLYINLSNAFGIVFRRTKKQHSLCYNKDYAALIADWLPHFKALQYLAQIKRDQLGHHLDSLCTHGFLSRWEIRKNSRESGFTLYFYAGPAFFEDYEYIQNAWNPQLRLSLAKNQEAAKGPYNDQRALLTYYFTKLYRGDGETIPDIFTEKDRAFAKEVLSHLTLDEAKQFVNYALDEMAPKSGYHPILFRGIEQYFIGYLSVKKKRTAQVALREEESLRTRYDDFWRSTITALRERIATEDLARLEREARKEVQAENPYHLVVGTLVRIRTNQKLGSFFGLPSFIEWKDAVAAGTAYSVDYFFSKAYLARNK